MLAGDESVSGTLSGRISRRVASLDRLLCRHSTSPPCPVSTPRPHCSAPAPIARDAVTPPLSCGGAPSATGTGPSKAACRNVEGRTVRRTGRTAAVRASPPAPRCRTRPSLGCCPATAAPQRRGTRGTSWTIRPASSDSAETGPKDSFRRTQSTVFRPFQPSLRRPVRNRHAEDGSVTPARRFFPRGVVRGVRFVGCLFELSPPLWTLQCSACVNVVEGGPSPPAGSGITATTDPGYDDRSAMPAEVSCHVGCGRAVLA